MKVFKSDFVRYQTLIGREGWQYVWNMDGITEILTGKTVHDEAQLRIGTRNIELRESWCQARGITYLHTIAPDKSSIYPEYLPVGVRHEPEGLLKKFSEALSKRVVTFVDLRDALLSWKDEFQVYFKTDSHWTYEAAYRVYLLIMSEIQRKQKSALILSEDMIIRKEKSKIMELSAITEDPQPETFIHIEPKENTAKCVYQTNSARGRIQVFEKEDKSLPRAVIFRDSFTSFFLPLICESFSRVTALNSRVFWYEIVEAEKPDVVLVEVAERYLDPVVTDLGRKTFFETFSVEISDIISNGEKNE